MSNTITNYFVINRKNDDRLKFNGWLNEHYISVKEDLYEPISTAADTARATYLKLLEEGIKECSRLKYYRPAIKFRNLINEVKSMSKAALKDLYKKAVEEEKKQHDQDINWKNKEYTEKNFHDIVKRASNFTGKISAEEKDALNAIKYVFSRLDADIDSMLPIASGVIDLTDVNSDCVSALVRYMLNIESILTKTDFNFSIENCHTAVWEIVYQFTENIEGLSSILDPVQLMPSPMPYVGSHWEDRAQALVAHDLVEGLRKIWIINPPFTRQESDYSEGSYANMVIGNILNPIFTYRQGVLKREWAEKASPASLQRKINMGAQRYGNKPDFSVILHYNKAKFELLFAEFSTVMADADKHHNDWCKLVRFAKDGYDAIQYLLNDLDPKNEAVIKARKELIRMPTFMLQVANTTIKFAALDSFLGVVLKDFPLLNFDIPLEPCGSDDVRDFVKNVLTIRAYVYDVATKLSDVWDDLKEPRIQAKHSSSKAKELEQMSVTTTSPRN